MTDPKIKILIVDDAPANLRTLTDTLEPHGYEILAAARGDVALKVAARALPDLILLDVVMPGQDGFEICRELKRDEITRVIPVIFITAKTDTADLVNGFRVGAVDYIQKPFQAEEVASRVETHLKIARLTRELVEKNHELSETNEALQRESTRREQAERDKARTVEHLTSISTREAQRWDVAGFVGKNKTVRKILDDVQRLQHFSNTSVLITGESGTGKELIARAIHFSSSRANEPFIPINCVAIPTELAESILFGHMRGSFTGATTDRKGCFELADGGTLFLDEIGDMPAIVQAKLLRVLEDGCVTPVGASQPRRVAVRIVAATNANLDEKIAAGSFRQDLFFRLARFGVRLPPLRERREDIPVLAAHFLNLFASEMGKKPPVLTREATAALKEHDFPGNVRELKNLIERALIESGGDEIELAHLYLPKRLVFDRPARELQSGSLPLNIEGAEDALIKRALAETNGNVAEAARLLGVNRTRIYRRFARQVK